MLTLCFKLKIKVLKNKLSSSSDGLTVSDQSAAADSLAGSWLVGVSSGPFALQLLALVSVSEPLRGNLVLDGRVHVTWRFKDGSHPPVPHPM